MMPGRDAALTTAQALVHGAAVLPQRAGLPDPRREASWLLARAWGRDESWLLAHPEVAVPTSVADRFDAWLERRAAGVPAHHLVGECPFWGREMAVGPDVLVPRPETELLVEACLQLALPRAPAVVDVGTGSGCVAITLAAERPHWRVAAVDLALEALLVARRNVGRHLVDVALWRGDLLASAGAIFDLVVANLPYIPTAGLAELPVEVGRDPVMALDGGEGGLVVVDRLLADARRVVAPGGFLALEIGEGQAEAVVRSAATAGLVEHRRVRDLGGCERVVVLQRGGG
jgi:release factor glutamine methyltransferase